jgi:hypothetical protein
VSGVLVGTLLFLWGAIVGAVGVCLLVMASRRDEVVTFERVAGVQLPHRTLTDRGNW